jgi:site-specific recombinase XerC
MAARCIPVRNKAARVKPVDELIKLGKALMREAETAPKVPALSRAVLFRDGLMIALLAYCPVRLSNLAMITFGRHLFCRTSGYDLYFSRDEVKWGLPFERRVPADLAAGFNRYLDHYRPVLLTYGGLQSPRASDALWISRKGTALHYRTIRGRIKEHTRVAFGQHLWPHLFRDCATTFVATEDPQHVRMVKSLLGHRKMRTSEKSYNQARSLEASRRYHRIVEDWLKGFKE